ncbi:hypothetical protein [Sediminitomix flava]|nr:hypothetical protein [Sediminitomix flava]
MTCFFLILGVDYLTLSSLNKAGCSVYRQDLGLQALYIYVDKVSDRYIIDYIYPFGKSTIIGTYTQSGEVVKLDKNLTDFFGLRLSNTAQMQFDLSKIEVVKK